MNLVSMADPRFGSTPVKTEQVHKTVRSLYIRLRVSVQNQGGDQQVKPIRIAVRPAFPRGVRSCRPLEADLTVLTWSAVTRYGRKGQTGPRLMPLPLLSGR